MENIFITGKNTTTAHEILGRFVNKFKVKISDVNENELKQALHSYIPDIILICLDGESNGEIRLYDRFFKQQIAYQDIPLIVAGSTSDIDNFTCFIDSFTSTYIYDPPSYDEIYLILNEKLETIQKKKQEQQSKFEPQIKEQEVTTESNLFQEDLRWDFRQTDSYQKSILIVDDDPRMLKALKNQLSDDYQVAVAINGQIAFNYLNTHDCDVVLLDYMMPGENGPAVLKKIRNTPGISDIPVVFLTGVNDSDLIRECLPLRPQGYLLKPVNKEKLQLLLKDIFSMTRW